MRVQSKSLLLAGQGPLLRVYDHGTRRLLCSKRVFHTQSVHGITAHQLSEHSIETLLLIWGRCSVCVLQVRIGDDENSQDNFHLMIRDVIAETETEDWILDASFTSPRADGSRSDCSVIEAVLVTAHNVVLFLHALLNFSSNSTTCASIYQLATGPRSILYSAHIVWQDANKPGLVAAGTVYGEILYWSFRPDYATRFGHSRQPDAGVLHHTFEGHEGSVFGVRISKEVSDEPSGLPKRVLASCSDDRTIRIWDISSYLNDDSGDDSTKRLIKPAFGGNDGYIDQRSSPSIAIAMGHASRVWGLRFLWEANSNRYLLSFGEDSTAQVWRLFKQPNTAGRQSNLSATTFLVLQNCAKHKFHSGKNIWACAVYQESVISNLVCTGGADGRIVCFNVHDPHVSPYGDGISSRWTFKEVLEDMSKACNPSEFEIVKIAAPRILSSIFIALEGSWKIFRNLDSAAPTYPSGSFEGTAIFEKRPPTNPKFEAEYLYLEDGKLTTQQGLSLVATRRYVYRLQKDTHAISSWFVKPDDRSTVDYLFHELNFSEIDGDQSKIGNIGNLVANGHHLCIDDDYRAEYGFLAREGTLAGWSLKYTVKGPKKDYIADAEYARDNWRSESKAEIDSNKSIGGESTEAILMKKKKNPGNLSKTDSFKAYTWINENVFLATTDLGWLLAGTLTDAKDHSALAGVDNSNSVSWEKIAKVDNLNGPCIATSICSHETAIFAASGTIHIYLHGDKSIHSPIKVPGKIAYMASHLISKYPSLQSNTFEIGIVITCLGSSTTYLFFVDVDKKRSKCSVRRDVILSRSPSFAVTSSCLIDSRAVLILGSRNGSLAIYKSILREIPILPASRIDAIHSKDAITSIENLAPTSSPEAENDTICFLTTGRNGTYAIHQIRFDSSSSFGSIDFHTVHVATTPIGNIIEGSHFSPQTNHLFLWGFRSKHFVLWNESLKQEIIISECGGAHRNWAFFPPQQQEGKTGGNLVWTKASSCHVHTQRGDSHIVLQEGGHGREIKALAKSPGIIITTPRINSSRSRSSSSINGRNTSQSSTESLSQETKRYLATGAEDTDIRIFDISSPSNSSSSSPFSFPRAGRMFNKCTNIISKHTTGLQALRWSRDSKYLFSAAGCDEFFVWRITPLPLREELGLQLGVVCEATAPTSEQNDLRVMDFDVKEDVFCPSDDDREGEDGKKYAISMAFSDSSVRVSLVFVLSPSPKILKNNSEKNETRTWKKKLNLKKKIPFFNKNNRSITTIPSRGHFTFSFGEIIQPTASLKHSICTTPTIY